ncbi:MAG: dihydrofolate reductase [Bacteroidales bacterium]|nr:dihydrofolate reductase [Bacteroidales bacterium]
MRKIILYAAQSLDGYIAEPDGSIGFLDVFNEPDGSDHGYAEFMNTIDTTLMGNNTYQQVLGFDMPFPYKNLENFVFTRNSEKKRDENVMFVNHDPVQFVGKLKKEKGKNIWLVGGDEINTLLLGSGMIDELLLFVAPVFLKEGIPLFSNWPRGLKINPLNSEIFPSRIIMLHYQVKNFER